MAKKQVVWFEEVDKEDISLVGGKGANLGEMTKAKFPVPYGFIVTSNAYFTFLREAELQKKIKYFLSMTHYEDTKDLSLTSQNIREELLKAEIPKAIAREVTEFYSDLNSKEELYFKKRTNLLKVGTHKIKHVYKPPMVAVRSSATAEDLPDASFAGQQETYLNIKGETHLLTKIKECWASLFTPRAIYYRHSQGFDHMKVGIAAVIQRMIQSEKSGISFSIDPVTNDKTKLIIEAIFGLGEYIVGGVVTPDHYEVDKRTLSILKKEVKRQDSKLIKSGNSNKKIRLSSHDSSKQKLTESEILRVAFLTKDVEKHYYFPQDIEWAVEKDRVFLIQTRPITTLNQNKFGSGQAIKQQKEKAVPILTGSPASPGIGVGPVSIIRSPKEISRIKHGDVLVAPQTNPDYVPAMKKAVAIVTEKGGRTSHAAIVSRELGIPAIVGAQDATKLLNSGVIVSVNGSTGEVFKGSVLANSKLEEKKEKKTKTLRTLTKVYVNLAEPEQAEKIAKMDVDGVGLLRAEFMIAEIGIHPKEFIRKKRESLFIRTLEKKLRTFARAFHPRPVIYRATDFKTNEYKNLVGGEHYESKEDNPMLGFRGAIRYIKDPEVFLLELEAIKKILQNGFHNLHLMIPFIRRPWELIKIKEIIHSSGLFEFSGFKLFMMVEVPSSALELEEFLKIGVDGVSIGTNDLTMMLLGVDRDNAEVSDLFDEQSNAVVSILEHIVSTCSKYSIPSSICGQAASDYPELIEKLVHKGITSVSVNPDALERTRELIYNIEHKQFHLKLPRFTHVSN